jgi:uncharacterized protein (TIGR03437 family)
MAVSYSVSVNTGLNARTGTLVIAGYTFTVTQNGSAFTSGGTMTEFVLVSPANEVPPVTGLNATGGFVVTIPIARDSNGNITGGAVNFFGTVTFPGSVTITGLNIHEANVLSNGPIVVNSGISVSNSLTFPTGSGLINITATNISPAVLLRFSKNPTSFYVNLNTTAYAGGALRGQMVRFVETLAATIQMSPANEVPPVTGLNARGTATITINPTRWPDTGEITSGTVSFTIQAEGFPAGTVINGLHIFEAPAGQNGPIIFSSGLSASNTITLATGAGSLNITVPITTANAINALQRLLANPRGFYVNLHTTANPTGAVRGQLVPLGAAPVIRQSNTYFLETGTTDSPIGLWVSGIDLASSVLVNGQVVTASLDIFTGGLAVVIPAALRANAGTLLVQARNGQGLMSAPLAIAVAAATNVNSTPFTTVNAASYAPGAAPDSIATGFGTNLASQTINATTAPLPTSLDGTTVYVNGIAALLEFVSPNQIRYVIPPGTAVGPAAVVVTSRSGVVSRGTIQIVAFAPGLYTADAVLKPLTTNASGRGVAFGVASRDGVIFNQATYLFDEAQNKHVAVPIEPGSFLALFGTGLRYGSSPVNVSIGGVSVSPTFVGAQSDFAGLDQVNLQIPSSLSGRGEVDIVLTGDGKTSNAVTVNIANPANPIPAPTSLIPNSATAGGAAFTLTVNGTNFVSGSIVRWNGSNRTTTFVSSTQLTAQIPASDIAVIGAASSLSEKPLLESRAVLNSRYDKKI